ncbi:GNAT family N-acetyltransferase [Vibrio algicola]|uniref:GNAT family N-acetyltransferase n=1 Tax=Vibrio algicola TaxID=2662262 RepID=A0A5Q0TMV2_9VIBR|nr:GNAT family N-acetyltransferase [Vibrio algicola]
MNINQSSDNLSTTQLANQAFDIKLTDAHISKIPDQVWPQIEQIQEQAYRDDLAENIDILKIKSDVSPETCFVCMDDEEQVLGYVLAHPWESSVPPCINQDISERGELVSLEEASTLYLHDLAISPDARGAGIAQALVENLLKHAQRWNIDKISLVAVQGMASFWGNYGFNSVKSNATDSYGDDAQMMVIQLPL